MKLTNKDHSIGQRQFKACNHSGKKSRNSGGIISSIKKISLNAPTNSSMTDTPLRRPLL